MVSDRFKFRQQRINPIQEPDYFYGMIEAVIAGIYFSFYSLVAFIFLYAQF